LFETVAVEITKAQDGARVNDLVCQLRGIDLEGVGETRPTDVEVVVGDVGQTAQDLGPLVEWHELMPPDRPSTVRDPRT
jgi:hypothetical protein